jgi:hypothetical protein
MLMAIAANIGCAALAGVANSEPASTLRSGGLCAVRKTVFFTLVVIGAAVGLVSATGDDWGVKIVMLTVGAVAGAETGLGMQPNDLMDNYWRDKGRPPLVSALEPEHGRHQFDPDKL